MKYLKILAAAAVAAAALMAFAGTASATELTVTNGTSTEKVKNGATLSAELAAGTEATLTSSFIGEVKCSASTVAGEVTNEGSASETVKGNITTLTFSSCNGTVTVLKNGTLEAHTPFTKEENGEEKQIAAANGNGTLTSNGAEVTVEIIGLHCIFSTSNTDVGTVTGGHAGNGSLNAESKPIPRSGGRSGAFCGSSATWRAQYTLKELVNGTNKVTNLTVD